MIKHFSRTSPIPLLLNSSSKVPRNSQSLAFKKQFSSGLKLSLTKEMNQYFGLRRLRRLNLKASSSTIRNHSSPHKRNPSCSATRVDSLLERVSGWRGPASQARVLNLEFRSLRSICWPYDHPERHQQHLRPLSGWCRMRHRQGSCLRSQLRLRRSDRQQRHR